MAGRVRRARIAVARRVRRVRIAVAGRVCFILGTARKLEAYDRTKERHVDEEREGEGKRKVEERKE